MRFRLQFRRYRLPFRNVVRTAHGPWGEREGVLLRLENGSGKVGYGEAAPIPWFGNESVDELETGCRSLGEWVDAESFATVPSELGCLHNALGAARNAFSDGHIPVDAPEWGVAALLPAGPAALDLIPAKVDAGFRVFKWKVGVADLSQELGLLDDVCALLPDGAKLRLDANGAWNVKQASRWLERCVDRPVEFLEQPVAPGTRGAYDILLGLAADFPTTIALDESVIRDQDVERWLASGWHGVYVIKPSLLSHPADVIARLAQAKARVVFSSALESAVGARAALELAFSWSGERLALGFGVWPLFADSRFDGPQTLPFLGLQEVQRIKPEVIWNALN